MEQLAGSTVARKQHQADGMSTRRNEPPEMRDGPDITANRARQGVTGHNVQYVLAFGLIGVIIAFAVIYAVFFAGRPLGF
jgi:hypothetical protein